MMHSGVEEYLLFSGIVPYLLACAAVILIVDRCIKRMEWFLLQYFLSQIFRT